MHTRKTKFWQNNEIQRTEMWVRVVSFFLENLGIEFLPSVIYFLFFLDTLFIFFFRERKRVILSIFILKSLSIKY